MKVEIISRELIKPSTPTPPSLKNYKISLVDELSPIVNVPLILYYPAAKSISTCNRLKNSLAETLTKFYPLAGRYVKDSHSVDCSNQGAEFVQAQVNNICLADLLGQGVNLKTELLNNLLPCPLGAADEIVDPLLAIQFNIFDCGGVAVAVCISHRVADMSTISTFIESWAAATRWERLDNPISPSFDDLALFFPGRNISGLHFGFPRSKENIQVHKIVTKLFCFNHKAISSVRGKATRTQSVFGIIWKALVDINKAAKHGHSGEFIVVQAVNMRERTFPPLPKKSCGNLYMFSTSQYVASESETEFQDFASLLDSSVKGTLEDCAKILSCGEDGQMMMINAITELNESLWSKPNMVNACVLTSWRRFPFYEADFGWGKPIWVSNVNVPLKNFVILMDDKEGEGIEAWVSLDEKDMPKFEENCIIKSFTTY